MNKRNITLPYCLMFIVCFMWALLSVKAVFADEDKHEHEYAGHHDEKVSHIDEDMASLNAISTAIVSGGDISKTLTLYGIVTLSPEHTSHVTDRFAVRITCLYVESRHTVQNRQVITSVTQKSRCQHYTDPNTFAGRFYA